MILDINIPLFVGLYIGWKLIKRTKAWKPQEMDFVTGIPTVEETENLPPPPTTIGGKIFDILF
jgi:amino acid transporter